jgi:hypothetical protein
MRRGQSTCQISHARYHSEIFTSHLTPVPITACGGQIRVVDCLLSYPLLEMVLTSQYLRFVWGTGGCQPPRKKIWRINTTHKLIFWRINTVGGRHIKVQRTESCPLILRPLKCKCMAGGIIGEVEVQPCGRIGLRQCYCLRLS